MSAPRQDTMRLVALTAMPGLASVVGGLTVASAQPDACVWWENLKKPSWAPKNLALYALMDISTLVPLGYASYLVIKQGLDDEQVKLAFASHCATQLIAFTIIPSVSKKNLRLMTAASGLTSASAAATALLFHRVDPTAGYLALPYCVWTAFYCLFTYSTAAAKQ